MKAKLPASFQPIFWDTSLRKVDPKKHRRYIVERLLQWGRPEQIRWMLRRYPKRFILKVNRESRAIRPRAKNFWQLYLTKSSRS